MATWNFSVLDKSKNNSGVKTNNTYIIFYDSTGP